MNKECHLIQELFPLYSENLVSPETKEYIEKHLAQCSYCQKTWEELNQPLLDVLPEQEFKVEQGVGDKLIASLKKTVVLGICFLLLGGVGLAYASYTAGKHVSLDDPSYRLVNELGLFTEINQTKALNNKEITLEKGIFDNSRTIFFLKIAKPGEKLLEISLNDEAGNEYLQRSSRVLQKKYYVVEFEPLKAEVENARIVLNYPEEKEEIEFLFPLDITRTLQHTRIVYPNIEEKVEGITVALQKAVLGVSQSEFKLKLDWPYEGSVAGIAVGREAFFPTSFSKIPDDAPPPPGPIAPGGLIPNYAATIGVNYRSEDPPINRPALYDLSRRQEITVQAGEYRTTQFPCQVEMALKFDLVEPQTEEVELVLPPIYVFTKANNNDEISLDFSKEAEIKLDKVITLKEGKIIINKAWLEKERVFISSRLEKTQDTGYQDLLPHFVLADEKEQKQGQGRFTYGKDGELFFSLFNPDSRKFSLTLDSMGELLPRQKYTIDISD
ncbi:MAG: hypothetical protein JM58_07645 [Peptococcaceae bacterium BICA1-8]|nr:MAG: hypothetical protein JM58_07645 [Peptococcaceae bacterium BICA1-8]